MGRDVNQTVIGPFFTADLRATSATEAPDVAMATSAGCGCLFLGLTSSSEE